MLHRRVLTAWVGESLLQKPFVRSSPSSGLFSYHAPSPLSGKSHSFIHSLHCYYSRFLVFERSELLTLFFAS